jgi:hypothetical protein
METMPAMIRALIAVQRHRIDMINLRYVKTLLAPPPRFSSLLPHFPPSSLVLFPSSLGASHFGCVRCVLGVEHTPTVTVSLLHGKAVGSQKWPLIWYTNMG